MSENYDIDKIKALIVSGLTAEQDDDTIRLEMFKMKVPFNKINSIFREISIAEGFRADPKVVKKGIVDELSSVDVETITEWSDVQELIDATVLTVNFATPKMVLAVLQSAANEAEVALPAKPRKTSTRRSGGSKIKSAIIASFNADNKITSERLFHSLAGFLEGDAWVRNTIKYVNTYLPMLIAATTGTALSGVTIDPLDQAALEKEYSDEVAGSSDESIDPVLL